MTSAFRLTLFRRRFDRRYCFFSSDRLLPLVGMAARDVVTRDVVTREDDVTRKDGIVREDYITREDDIIREAVIIREGFTIEGKTGSRGLAS